MRCLCCVRGGGCAIHRAGGVLGYVSTHLSYAYYAGWSNCSAPHGPLAHSILQPVLEYYDCPHPADESYCARSWACCPYNITVTSTAMEGLQPGINTHTAHTYTYVYSCSMNRAVYCVLCLSGCCLCVCPARSL